MASQFLIVMSGFKPDMTLIEKIYKSISLLMKTALFNLKILANISL
jgi:hypothetical protein